jgi:hypothetical protein
MKESHLISFPPINYCYQPSRLILSDICNFIHQCVYRVHHCVSTGCLWCYLWQYLETSTTHYHPRRITIDDWSQSYSAIYTDLILHIESVFGSEFNFRVLTYVVTVPQKRMVMCKMNTPILLQYVLAVSESKAPLGKPHPPVQ